MEQTKKSLCCGADVRFNFDGKVLEMYSCSTCNKPCKLQKNSGLTLAEVYAVRDDVNDWETMEGVTEKFTHLFTTKHIFETRYRITDRKSWHRHEKKAEPDHQKDSMLYIYSMFDGTNKNKESEITKLKEELEKAKAESRIIEASRDKLADDYADLKRKSEWLPFPENKPSCLSRYILVTEQCDWFKAYYDSKGRFFINSFDITDQVKFFKEIE